MARARSRFTVSEFGSRTLLEARGITDLARQLSDLTCWTLAWCTQISERVYRGEAFVALDFETIIFPGDVPVYEARPDTDHARVLQRYAE